MSYPWSTISRQRERMMKSIFMGLLLFLIGSSSADAQTRADDDFARYSR